MHHAYVTGGSGFLGKRLIAALVARGVQVIAMARSDAAAAAVTAAGATPARGDLADRDAMTAAMRGCDAVFHAAAHVEQHGPLAPFMAINVAGTEHALAAARAAGVVRFVHIGTEAVLADGKPIIRADETVPRPDRTAGPYPFTKGLAEAAVVEGNGEGLETVVVRPRFIWGKGDTSVLPQIIDAVKRGRFAWLGGGRYLTSTCHVDNVVEGTLLAAERGRPAEIYFLTDGAPVEFRDFMTRLLATQGVDASGVRDVPVWLARVVAGATSWMKHPPVTRTAIALVGHEVTLDDSKARRELGYQARTTIDAGLAQMRA
ncbi:MAG TPA: NAD-dependent epimerase/dehydratase family protein [Kofleriaceae bacterium]|nr:NAD-dependent epimerase/dehydratase family protein [Kofleriaceae bacterium]HMG51901.1 NAD-dependent epimerase/dehydratase family protein [Kofleriaceae bacterium]